MGQPIIMPKFNQATETSTILRWLKKEGDTVRKGELIFEVETDKAIMEVESFLEGTLLKIWVPEGQEVPVQTPVAYVGKPGEPIPERGSVLSSTGEPTATATAPAVPTPAQPPPLSESVPSGAVLAEPASQPGRLKISPRALALAQQNKVDPTLLTGTGPGGRIIERDIEANLGRSKTQRAQEPRPQGAQPLSKMRKTIGQRLLHSVRTAPHFFVTVSVDMTDLLALRSQPKAQGAVYSVTDFIIKAAALALREFPQVNSTTDGQTMVTHPDVHIGLAVSVDAGLLVPVIRDADKLSLQQIHERASILADKARSGKLLPQEMSGSTFTISNMGMMDVENFIAIINPGESAILAIAGAIPKPVVRNNQIVIRSMMTMTLSADHRLLDGALAALFLNAIKQKLHE